MWVTALTVAGGVLVGSAVVYVVGQPRSSSTPGPSTSIPISAAPGSISPSMLQTSESPSAAESAQPSLGVAPGWSVSDFTAADPGDQLERIVALGDQIFVIGSHGGQGGIWHSVDGVGWHLASGIPHVDTVLGIQIHGIARSDAGYVAVGANYAVDVAFPLIWHSLDGDHWTDVTPNPRECLSLAAVAAVASKFVAVGGVCRYDAEANPHSDAVSFASEDGVHWERSPSSKELIDLDLGDVTWSGSEAIATGVHFGTWSQTFRSVDGLTWAASPGGGVPAAGFIRRLSWAIGRFVGFGQHNDSAGRPHATVWRSTDAQEWSQSVVGGAKTQASGIALLGQAWVLVGGVIQSDTTSGPIVEWRSADGITWGEPRVIILNGGNFISDVAAIGTRLIAIGGVPAPNGEQMWNPVILRGN